MKGSATGGGTGNAAETDARLARAFAAGDRSSFDRLVERHQDRIYNLCLWMLGDPAEAEDAAQETFIKAYRSLGAFRFKSAFSTWLYRIAVNTCKNRRSSLYFRFRRTVRRIGGAAAGNAEEPPWEAADPAPSPDEELLRKESAALVLKAMGTLPPARRTAVVLRDVEELSYEEIAAVTETAVGTVKSRIARGRQELQQKLKGLI
jgi:RNA polymerase sigma-70 factor (ECF subfamily)